MLIAMPALPQEGVARPASERPPEGVDGINAYSIGCIEGMARPSTLLAMLLLIKHQGWALADQLPRRASTASNIWLHHLPQVTSMGEALQRTDISCAGADPACTQHHYPSLF